MTASSVLPRSRPVLKDLRSRVEESALLVIVGLQAVWLFLQYRRGWFYGADFTALSRADHRSLSWRYLFANDRSYLSPGGHLEFWLIAHTAGLNYPVTVVVRLVLQAAATILLYHVVHAVSRSQRISLVITSIYCVSPLLVPGSLYLASATNLLPAQVCGLLAFAAHIRHVRRRSWWTSALAGVALLLAAAFWPKTAIDTAAVLTVFSVGWLSVGSLGARLRVVLRDLVGWILTLGPLLGLGVYYLRRANRAQISPLPAVRIAHLAWVQWSRSLWPSVIGAPWHWFDNGGFDGFGAPGLAAVVLGQLAFVALLVRGWRRRRWAGLAVWLIPAVAVVAGVLVISLSPYDYRGSDQSVDYAYVFDLAVPMALAFALAVAGMERAGSTATVTAVPVTDAPPAASHRLAALAAVAAIAAVVVSSAASVHTWTSRWHDSPTHRYVDTLAANIRRVGPAVSLYDTPSPAAISRPAGGYLPISTLLQVAGVTASFDGDISQLAMVDSMGDIRPATFRQVAIGLAPPQPVCSTPISGAVSVTVPFSRSNGSGPYFLLLGYFQRRVNTLTVTVHGSRGQALTDPGGSVVTFGQALSESVVRLSSGVPRSVTASSHSATSHICLSTMEIGIPATAAP